MKLLRRPVVLILLALMVAMMFSVFSGIQNWKRDLTTNHARLDTSANDPLMRPVSLSLAPAQAAEQIRQWVATQKQWSVASSDETDSVIRLHLTRTTKLFRFVDDVHVELHPEGSATRVEAESQSRVGKGDLGQNPRNLQQLVQALRTT